MDLFDEKKDQKANNWTDYSWDPNANLCAVPGGVEILDVSGDGDWRILISDLDKEPPFENSKVKLFRGTEKWTEHPHDAPPCGIIGFHTENDEPRSVVLAVASGPYIYIYKNMSPHFKYKLPPIDCDPEEHVIWQRVAKGELTDAEELFDELEILSNKIKGCAMSPRSALYTSMKPEERLEFLQRHDEITKFVPLSQLDVCACIATIKKDSWSDPGCSFLIIGTEDGSVLIMDPRAFFVTDKFQIGYPPVAFATCGLWVGEGQIVVIGRHKQIGVIKCGESYQAWDKFPTPPIALATTTDEGVAVVTMDKFYWGLSKQGERLWMIELPDIPLDIINVPISYSGFSLLAVSVRGKGIYIYDDRHLVDIVQTIDSVSAMKFGPYKEFERVLVMVTAGGGLGIKILNHGAIFNPIYDLPNIKVENNIDKVLPKRTQIFYEQNLREQRDTEKMYNAWKEGFLRLRLRVAQKALEIKDLKQEIGLQAITMESAVLGLGPNYVVKIELTNTTQKISESGLFLICRCENVIVKPRLIELSLIPANLALPITVSATTVGRLPGKLVVLLCKKGNVKPLTETTAILPAAEEDIEI